jgi:hypothetical protein
MTLYVQGKSKKALNELLANGTTVIGTEYSLRQPVNYTLNSDLPHGTVIKVYEKIIGGNPYAKAYGTWEKNKIK